MDQNTQQIGALLKEGKTDEARALMKEMLSVPLTDEEQGAALVALASAYLDATNAADAAHIEALEKAIAAGKGA